MAATAHYLDTALNGRGDYNLPSTAPGATTLVSSNVNNTAFQTCLQASFLIGAATIDNIVTMTNVDIVSFSGSAEIRWQLFVPDPVSGDKFASGWSGLHSTTGPKLAALVLNPTLVSGDYYGLRVQIRRTGGHGNVNVTLGVSTTQITPDYTPPAGPTEEWWFIT